MAQVEAEALDERMGEGEPEGEGPRTEPRTRTTIAAKNRGNDRVSRELMGLLH